MNNPPTTEPVDHETEHYAHDVSKHVRGYLLVGATLLAFTGITVALSYVNLGSQKANVAVAMLVATFKAGLVAYIFMHLSAEKKLNAKQKSTTDVSQGNSSFTKGIVLFGTGKTESGAGSNGKEENP